MATHKRTAAPPAAQKKILIVDDHPLMREGLRGTINHEPDLCVCGEAANASQAIAAVAKLRPDMVLTDVTLPGRSGLELIKDLKALHPRLDILAISMHDESLFAERTLRAGASGYITKHERPAELVKAIRRVLEHQMYVSTEMSEKLLRRFTGKSPATESPMEILSDRELEIFQLLGKAVGTKEISQQLNLSPKTVAVHNANIRRKLKLKSTSELIRFAVQNGQ